MAGLLPKAGLSRGENADKYENGLLPMREAGLIRKVLRNRKSYLVRIRLTDVDRVKFTQEANEQTVAALPTEQAAVDSRS